MRRGRNWVQWGKITERVRCGGVGWLEGRKMNASHLSIYSYVLHEGCMLVQCSNLRSWICLVFFQTAGSGFGTERWNQQIQNPGNSGWPPRRRRRGLLQLLWPLWHSWGDAEGLSCANTLTYRHTQWTGLQFLLQSLFSGDQQILQCKSGFISVRLGWKISM